VIENYGLPSDDEAATQELLARSRTVFHTPAVLAPCAISATPWRTASSSSAGASRSSFNGHWCTWRLEVEMAPALNCYAMAR